MHHETQVTLSRGSLIQLAFIAPILMLSVCMKAFIYFPPAQRYLAFSWGTDLKRDKRYLKGSKNVNMDDFAEDEFHKCDCFFSFFIRIGWILPKRLKSKFGVSVADRHTHAHTHIPTIHNNSHLNNCWWFFTQLVPGSSGFPSSSTLQTHLCSSKTSPGRPEHNLNP